MGNLSLSNEFLPVKELKILWTQIAQILSQMYVQSFDVYYSFIVKDPRVLDNSEYNCANHAAQQYVPDSINKRIMGKYAYEQQRSKIFAQIFLLFVTSLFM